MKKIIINGKHTNVTKRKNVNLWSYPLEVLKKNNQVNILNKLYLGQQFNGFMDVRKELKNKISSYSQQDKKRNIFNNEKIINYDQCIEKIVLSKLICYYCRENMLLMYEDKREPLQWTLDRLNNNLGHNKTNVVICCLKCNLNLMKI